MQWRFEGARLSRAARVALVCFFMGNLFVCLPLLAAGTDSAPTEKTAGIAAEADSPASNGTAVAVDASRETPPSSSFGFSFDPQTWTSGVLRLIHLGGPVVAVQLCVSIIGLTIILYKTMQFLRVRSGALAGLNEAINVWSNGDVQKGSDMLKRNGLGFAKDVEYALTTLRSDNIETVREELYRRARVYLQPLHDHLPVIEIIYYIAPLLGLLGTVTGIIASFQALEASGAANDSAKLAGGIWEALIATGVGLTMAIPFAVLHSLLETRLNRIVSSIENVIARVFTSSLDATASKRA